MVNILYFINIIVVLLIPFSSYIVPKYNPKLMVGLAILVGIPSILTMGYTQSSTVFIVSYSLAFGFVCGVAYMVPIHAAWEWFPKHSGLASGIIIGSIGVGAIIFDQVAISMCNPNNIPAVNGIFPPEVTKNVPRYRQVTSWVFVGMQLLVLLLVFPAPPKAGDSD